MARLIIQLISAAIHVALFLIIYGARLTMRLVRLVFPNAFPRALSKPQRPYVVDGDTIHLPDGTKVRLMGIDAPEMTQFGGLEAKQYLERLIGSKNVRIEQQDQDRYGRVVARVFTEDGYDLCGEMVAHGYARAYTQYCTDYVGFERAARKANLGLWANGNLRIHPSEFRKRNA